MNRVSQVVGASGGEDRVSHVSRSVGELARSLNRVLWFVE